MSCVKAVYWAYQLPLAVSLESPPHPIFPNLVWPAPCALHRWLPPLAWRGYMKLPAASTGREELHLEGVSCALVHAPPLPPRSHFPLCRHSRGCIKDTIPHWLPISKYLKVCLMKRLAKQEFFSLDWIHFTLLQMSITVFRCLPWFGFKHNFLAFLSLFLGENVPSYRRQRVEDRQLCTQCERFYLRGDSAWDEESQGVSGSVCKGGRLQESGTYLPAGVNLMKMSNLKLTHMVKNHFCCLIVQI